MVQADSLMPGTCYWSVSSAELGGDRRAEAAGCFVAASRELASGSAPWIASAIADVVILVCEAALAHRLGDYPRVVDLLANRPQILSRQSRNQTGAKTNSSSAVRAILDDPPIHIRPVCSRKRGCGPRTLWVQRFSARP